MIRKLCSNALRLALPSAAALTLFTGAATASSPNEIEGVWSFNGGAVDIQGRPGNTFVGVVVSPTQFAKCSHPVSQEMWTEITPQADGSYWGKHLWYFEGPECAINPTRGKTAWRVITEADGNRHLVVCFASPESEKQPTISPSGVGANYTAFCSQSAAISALPKAVPSFATSRCRRGTTLLVKLHNAKYDPYKRVEIWVNGKKAADVRNAKKITKGIRLKKLPTHNYTVKVLAITVLNHRLTGTRHYNSCSSASGNIKLSSPKHGHKKQKKKKG